MPCRSAMEKLVHDARAWIRNRSIPSFLLDGPVKTEVSFRWWPSDEGYTTMWVCLGSIADNVEDDRDVVLVGEFDDGPRAEADRRFHVDRLDSTGSSSWEVDAMLNAEMRIRTKKDVWSSSPVCNLAMLLNAFLWISKDNVERNGVSSAGVLAGRVIPQRIMRDGGWDKSAGPCPSRRWYYQPWGTWTRGQTHEAWDKGTWLKPIPLFGQLVDPELVSSYTDVDVDMDGNPLKV